MTKWDRIQNIRHGMKKRCLSSKHIGWIYYGGRGIKICERWLDDHLIQLPGHQRPVSQGSINFYNDMESTWFPGATIHRVDNNGDYCLENCRWVTRSENNREMNKRRLDDGSHHLLGGKIQRESNQRRVSEGNHNFQGKGKMNVLDITDGKFHLISKEEYEKGKGIKYFNPNSKVAKELKYSNLYGDLYYDQLSGMSS